MRPARSVNCTAEGETNSQRSTLTVANGSGGELLMRVKMILPALTEATSPFFRPIKYSLFPPLGLATLAGYLRADDEVRIWDEHVRRLDLDDDRPDLAVIQVYVTSARRSYELADAYRARGVFVAPGRHLDCLDDHLFGNRRFATALFDGMRGMGRVWQAAGTVDAVLAPDLLERAAAVGLRSLFVGFETVNPGNLAGQRKRQNIGRD